MKALITFLIYLYIILLPFGNLFRIKIVNTVQIVPQDLIVGVIAVSAIYYLVFLRKKIIVNPFLKYQLLFLGFGLVSLLVNSMLYKDISIVVSFLYIARYLSYLLLIFAGIYFAKKENLLRAIYAALIFFLSFGFVQYFFFYDLRPLFYLGWDNHLYRLTSTFFDPNFAGSLLVILFWLGAYYTISNSFRKSVVHIFILFASLVGIYLTFSRTSLITLLVGITVFCVIKKKLRMLFLIIIIMTLSVFLLSDTHVEGLNPLRTASSNERLIGISQSLTVFSKNPIYGVGFNAYRYAQLRFGLREEKGASISNSDAGADNSYLLVLATTGIVGFFFFMTSYIVLIRSYIKERGGIFSHIYIAIIVSLLGGSMFTNVLFYTPIIGVLFMLIPVGWGKVKVGK